MTAAKLRFHTNQPPALPVSRVLIVDPSGNRWAVAEVETVTPRDADGRPTGIPVLVFRIVPE